MPAPPSLKPLTPSHTSQQQRHTTQGMFSRLYTAGTIFRHFYLLHSFTIPPARVYLYYYIYKYLLVHIPSPKFLSPSHTFTTTTLHSTWHVQHIAYCWYHFQALLLTTLLHNASVKGSLILAITTPIDDFSTSK